MLAVNVRELRLSRGEVSVLAENHIIWIGRWPCLLRPASQPPARGTTMLAASGRWRSCGC